MEGASLDSAVARLRAGKLEFTFRVPLWSAAGLAAALALGVIGVPRAALAACNQADTNQTCTNSVAISGNPVGIDDTDTLTLTNTASGSVTGSSSSADAKGINADTAIVSNSGTIAGIREGNGRGYGIFAVNNAEVTNSDTISGTGTGTAGAATGIGIYVDASDGTAKVTNSGTIIGTGTGDTNGDIDGRGIIASQTAEVTNSGTIIGIGTGTGTSGKANGYGIDAIETADITNSGVISGTGTTGADTSGDADGRGINASQTAEVTNSGIISGTGTSTGKDGKGYGIKANQTAEVTNSGIISGTGTGTDAGSNHNGKGDGYGIYGGEKAEVTNSGIISGTGTFNRTGAGTYGSANGYGIGGQTVEVTNSGTISGTGTVTGTGNSSNGFGYGIFANKYANVTNSGTITGTGNGTGTLSAGLGWGIYIGNALGTANVINSGTITGTGTTAGTGIEGRRTATVTNSGTIIGTANGTGTNVAGYGIRALTVEVTNSGTIIGTGTASGNNVGKGYGIYASSTDNKVINSGTISGNGTNEGYGILANGGTAGVINSGTISGSGINTGYGIYATDTANVINSGTISGTTAALQFSTAADTLTLLPGSRIIGAINMGFGGDVVNVVTGRDISWLVTLSEFEGTINVSGGQPSVVVGNQIATLDPTPFAMADRTLMDFSRLVSSSVPVFGGLNGDAAPGGGAVAYAAPDTAASRIEEVFASIPGLAAQPPIGGLTAYAPDPLLFKNPRVVYGDGSALWARGFAGARLQKADGVLFGATNKYYGGMIGGDWQAWPNLRLGAFVGAGATRTDIDLNAGDTDSDLVFGGGFARYALGTSVLHLGVQGGASRNDTSRTIANNLAPGGIQTATANYDGWYVSPEIGYWQRYGLGTWAGTAYMLTPNLRVRYLYGSYDGYTETGSAANLTVAGRDVQNVEERGELRLTAQTGAMGHASLYGGVLAVQRIGDSAVDSVLLGQPLPFAILGKGDVWGGFAGGEAEARFGAFALFAGAEWMALSDDSTIVSGKGGLRVNF